MADLEQLERITRELDSLDDSDLVAAGNEVHKVALRWRAVDTEFQREIRLRAEEEGASIILGGDVDAEVIQPLGAYEWDAAALDANVRPLLGDRLYAEVVSVVPHVCPPPALKVNTVKLTALMRQLGRRGEGVLERCYTRAKERPRVEYVERTGEVA